MIDTFACDSKNKKPVCYSVDVKKGESVPNLLRHNLQVRVGKNGVVRTEKKMAITPETGNGKQGKKRTAPLNWEEQLNWQNVSMTASFIFFNFLNFSDLIVQGCNREPPRSFSNY